jgi:hypothetical protein
MPPQTGGTSELVGGEQQPMAQPPPSLFSSAPAGQRISQSLTPPASLLSSQTVQQNVGFIIASCGGVVALFAFFLLPYLSLGFLGSLTGAQLASVNNQLIQGMGVLWLEPLVAAAVIGIAIYSIVKSQRDELDKQVANGLAVALILLAGITLFVLFLRYLSDAQPPQSESGFAGPSLASFYGAGMWIYFLAMLAVLAGGIVQLRSFSVKK